MAKINRAELQRRGALSSGGDTPGRVKTTNKANSFVDRAVKAGASEDDLSSALVRRKGGKKTGTTSSLGEIERAKSKIDKKAAEEKESTVEKKDEKKDECIRLGSFEDCCSEFDESFGNWERKAGLAGDEMGKTSFTNNQEIDAFSNMVTSLKGQGMLKDRMHKIVNDIFSV